MIKSGFCLLLGAYIGYLIEDCIWLISSISNDVFCEGVFLCQPMMTTITHLTRKSSKRLLMFEFAVKFRNILAGLSEFLKEEVESVWAVDIPRIEDANFIKNPLYIFVFIFLENASIRVFQEFAVHVLFHQFFNIGFFFVCCLLSQFPKRICSKPNLNSWDI